MNSPCQCLRRPDAFFGNRPRIRSLICFAALIWPQRDPFDSVNDSYVTNVQLSATLCKMNFDCGTHDCLSQLVRHRNRKELIADPSLVALCSLDQCYKIDRFLQFANFYGTSLPYNFPDHLAASRSRHGRSGRPIEKHPYGVNQHRPSQCYQPAESYCPGLQTLHGLRKPDLSICVDTGRTLSFPVT